MRRIAFFSFHQIVLALVVLLLIVPTWADDTPQSRASLKGITTLKVVVENMNPDAERDGLTTNQIQTDVELRLRQAGITLSPTASAFLYVAVPAQKRSAEFPLYGYAIAVELIQPVIVPRDQPIAVYATTWSIVAASSVGAANLRTIRSFVVDYIDRFINAYLEQNPRQ